MSKLETGLISSIVFGLYLLLVFSLGLMKPSVDVGLAELTPTDLLFPAVILLWLGAIAEGRCDFRWRWEFLIFAGFFLTLTISSFFSVNPRLSFGRLPGSAYLILLAVLTSNLVTTFSRLRISILVWLAGSTVPLLSALTGIFLFYFLPDNRFLPDLIYHYGAVPVGNFPRIGSTFISASMFCNYLTVTLAFALLSARMRWVSNGVAAALIFTIGVCALFTVSIALGGFALAAGLWIWITSPSRTIARASLIFGSVVAIAFLAVAPFALINQGGSSFFLGLEPSSRFQVWGEAVHTFLSAPLTGNGLGTAVANVAFHNYDGTWSLLTDAHNTFLSVAAQAGFFGLAAIAAIVVVTMNLALARSTDDENGRYILRCFGIAFFTAFFYDGLTGSFEDTRHLWVLIGFILAGTKITDWPDESHSLHRA
ncbi:MAG: O-antigen ligase family protein [Pyrinomonadaceae bacterium]